MRNINSDIGNTIEISISVLTGGEPVSLIEKQISVVLASPSKGTEKITNWSIDEEKSNVIKFNIEHNPQDYKGIYKVLVYDNNDIITKKFIYFDHNVWHITKENGEEYDTIIYPDKDGDDKPDEQSDYSAVVDYIPPKEKPKDGVSVVSIDQIEESTESLGQNVIRVTLSNEEYFDFVIRNGAQGQKGNTPQKGVDYFTESEIQNIVEEIEENITSTVEEATEDDINEICV